MPKYNKKTPGVYVDEISTIPPSVSEVSTAIPAFFGYTQEAPDRVGSDPVVRRIESMLDYEGLFGQPYAAKFTVQCTADGKVSSVARNADDPEFLLYYAVSHYFRNGGGPCYIVSVGGYAANPTSSTNADAFTKAIERLAQEDEPTLLVLTDAVSLPADNYYSVCAAALAHCSTLQDRFAIIDVKRSGPGSDAAKSDVAAFRDKLASEPSKRRYGAAYHPYLETLLTYHASDSSVTVNRDAPASSTAAVAPATLGSLSTASPLLYNQVRSALASQRVVLPPSAAMAGSYCRVDRDRGVWKAPANVPVADIAGPALKITDVDQASLNDDPISCMPINAIRFFTGKGTLVWGARTLDGASSEWRYVPVRRLFNMIEESARKATAFAVFEPNDMTTWLKVKGMLESFLYGLWERGALAGPTPAAAYYVQVGLGKTMTRDDVLAGYLIIDVGVAAVRPAEFIVFRFSHKMQEA